MSHSTPAALLLGTIIACAACDTLPPPPLGDVAQARDVRADATTRDTTSVSDADAEVVATEPPTCAAFFFQSQIWDSGLVGNAFFEYDGPPLTSWTVRLDFGVPIRVQGAWSGSGHALESPRYEGTAMIFDLTADLWGGQLGVEFIRFDLGITASRETSEEVGLPVLTLDGLECEALE